MGKRAQRRFEKSVISNKCCWPVRAMASVRRVPADAVAADVVPVDAVPAPVDAVPADAVPADVAPVDVALVNEPSLLHSLYSISKHCTARYTIYVIELSRSHARG